MVGGGAHRYHYTISMTWMAPSLTERDRKELKEILDNPARSAELANKTIDARVLQ